MFASQKEGIVVIVELVIVSGFRVQIFGFRMRIVRECRERHEREELAESPEELRVVGPRIRIH